MRGAQCKLGWQSRPKRAKSNQVNIYFQHLSIAKNKSSRTHPSKNKTYTTPGATPSPFPYQRSTPAAAIFPSQIDQRQQ